MRASGRLWRRGGRGGWIVSFECGTWGGRRGGAETVAMIGWEMRL